MNHRRFMRYVDQFGLDCVEQQFQQNVRWFVRLWSVLSLPALIAFLICLGNTHLLAVISLVVVILMVVFGIGVWQRYQWYVCIRRCRDKTS